MAQILGLPVLTKDQSDRRPTDKRPKTKGQSDKRPIGQWAKVTQLQAPSNAANIVEDSV